MTSNRRVIDYKSVDMTDPEWEYYNKLVEEFTYGNISGKEQFKDVFDVDGDGCISMISPPFKKEVGGAVILFLQNLMINRQLRRMERLIKEKVDDR
jgi:hypothetical protein